MNVSFRRMLGLLAPLTLVTSVNADPIDSFPNITHAPPTHFLEKRGGEYAKLDAKWPDKTLMYSSIDNKHWWSDEPWASGWYYTPGHTGNITGPVVVMYYENTEKGYDWKSHHATAKATCTGGFRAAAPASQTITFNIGTASPYVTSTATEAAFFTCASTL